MFFESTIFPSAVKMLWKSARTKQVERLVVCLASQKTLVSIKVINAQAKQDKNPGLNRKNDPFKVICDTLIIRVGSISTTTSGTVGCQKSNSTILHAKLALQQALFFLDF